MRDCAANGTIGSWVVIATVVACLLAAGEAAAIGRPIFRN